MDDSALYTGVDDIKDGVFGNETLDKDTQLKLDEQRKQIAELTPKLKAIVDMLDAEKALMIDFITGYVDGTNDSEENLRAELKAAGMYRKYLDELKTKFALMLNETERKAKK